MVYLFQESVGADHGLIQCRRKQHVPEPEHRFRYQYRKILIISPGLIYLLKRLFCWAYFRGNLFSEGLVIEGNFVFQHGFGMLTNTAKNTETKA